MLKQVLIAAAASALLAGTAFSQTPQASQPNDLAKAAQEAAQAQAQQHLAMQEMPNQLLASQLKGANVVDAQNQKIGSINDVLFNKNGNVLAYIVGMNGKEIAINPSAFHPGPASQGKREFKLEMSKNDLKAMPAFKSYQQAALSTVGRGSTMARPGGSPAPHQ
ncbi:MAG TPA: PRC-barrel domain-containing protein [Xanthobacteraceae bacterium]